MVPVAAEVEEAARVGSVEVEVTGAGEDGVNRNESRGIRRTGKCTRVACMGRPILRHERVWCLGVAIMVDYGAPM